MRNKWFAAASFSLATFALSANAQAAAIVRTYDLHATRFVQSFGFDPTPPQVSANLNVTLTFDNSANVATTTNGLVVNSFDLPYGVEFEYGSAFDTLSLATDIVGPGSCQPGHGTFCAFIHGATSATPTLIYFNNSLNTSPQNVWVAEGLSLSFSDAPGVPGVPEPGVWAMMLMGFAGLGTALRRRRATLAMSGT